MKKIIRPTGLFLISVLIAVIVRFWQLGNIPPSLDWDEAALGYNAYSIAKTGRDEYGTKLPLTIRSFDDYKPPLYTYLTVPSVAVFGLEPWAVRLPSALMGIAAVIGSFLLTKKLLEHANIFKTQKLLSYIPPLTSFLLAISPWHIQFSRIAFEANSGLTINIWALVAFFWGLTKRRFLTLSAFLFGLSLYAYHSERIFSPLLVLMLIIIFRDEFITGFRKDKKNFIVAVFIGIIVVSPLIPIFLNKTTLTRLRGTSALADQTGLLAQNVKRLEYDKSHGIWTGVIFDNRRLVWAKTLMDGYLSHYSLRWLFLTGDNARHHAPDMGLLYLWELPFLLYGMFLLAQKGGGMGKLLWGWFLIAPIAAAPTTELPHAIRTLVFLPTFQIFTAVGFVNMLPSIKRQISKIHTRYIKYFMFLIVAFYIFFIACNITYYLHMYFGHTNYEYSQFWQYGYKDAALYANSHETQYKKIVVSTKLEQSYMFFLFYLKYDPVLYLEGGGTKSGGFAEYRNRFGIYEFRPIQWSNEIHDGSILYIGTPGEISGQLLATIHYLDGKDAVRIADH